MNTRPGASAADHELPEVIRRYQHTHDRHDTAAALAAFTPDVWVRDDGHEYRGAAEIGTWLGTAASEYSFTRTFIGAEAVDDGAWLVVNHLEGNFPGGVVDLRYQFGLSGDLISSLVIAP